MTFWIFGIYNLFENGLINLIRTALQLQPDSTGEALLVGGGFLFCTIAAYLLGSINWALVISRTVYHDDVRRHGSGNAGTTNVLRTYGKKAAAFTFLGDGLKGVVAVLLACLVFGFPAKLYSNPDAFTYDIRYIQLITACYLSATMAVLGHILPCFSKFKGGKGFATFAWCALVLNPGIFLVLAAIFITIVLGTQYVSLGSVVTVLFYPILLHSFDSAGPHYGVGGLFALCIAALVVWSHRTNLKRLMNHTENKTRVFKKKSAETGAENKENK